MNYGEVVQAIVSMATAQHLEEWISTKTIRYSCLTKRGVGVILVIGICNKNKKHPIKIVFSSC